MNSEQKELFRLAVLKVLETNKTRFGLGVPAVQHLLVRFGFPFAEGAAVEDALGYLSDPGREFAEEELKGISKENRAWRITKKGRAFLDERGG